LVASISQNKDIPRPPRHRPPADGLAGLLPDTQIERLRQARFASALVLLELGRIAREWRQQDKLEPLLAPTIEGSLNQISCVLGGGERIASTPQPFTYTVILHRSAYLYCMLLPFGLVDSIGFMTPLAVTFVSYTFFALEALSDEIEDPFGEAPNDLALDAMTAGIDAPLREMLGETPPLVPQPDNDFRLTGSRISRQDWRRPSKGRDTLPRTVCPAAPQVADRISGRPGAAGQRTIRSRNRRTGGRPAGRRFPAPAGCGRR
jgi:hypothetical protein